VFWSDHWAFWREGFRAVMVTDTAPFRYRAYHTARDTPDKLDYERMAMVVVGLAEVVRDLAS
jgi:Zn-dependent M28 family amino/carboxypeptidase